MIPDAIIPTKVRIKGSLSTFFRIINSGSEIPITDIIKANAVPKGTPFPISALAIGTAPAEQEYKGIPIKTDKGTEYQRDLPTKEAR